jgi:hypothetical protein
MEENRPIKRTFESIRKLMERSVKFISLSGLSGILAGRYALRALAASFRFPIRRHRLPTIRSRIRTSLPTLGIAAVVLMASILTGVMSSRKRRKRVKFWDTTSKRPVINLADPAGDGGLLSSSSCSATTLASWRLPS